MTPFRFGPYTVRQEIRTSDRLLHYVITRGGKVVGYSASALDLGWCAAIERQNRATSDDYAYRRTDYHLRGRAAFRSGRPTKAAVAQREAELLIPPTE